MKIKNIKSHRVDLFLREVLKRFDLKPEETNSIVEHLIEANLLGVDSHGLQQIFGYYDSLNKGRIKTNTKVSLSDDLGYLVKVNGNGGAGQWVGDQVVDLIMDRICKYRFCTIAVTNSNHFGMSGYYSKKLALNNIVSYITSDTNVVDLIPYGQSTVKVGNNPITYGFPLGNNTPFILDMALGEVSGGKVKHFTYNNEKVPESWVNNDGKNISNSRKLSHLALISDLLCGPMLGTQGSFFKEKPIYNSENATGHLFTAYDPTYFSSQKEFNSYCSDLILNYHEKNPYPGMIENQIKKERVKNGIPFPQDLLLKLEKNFPSEYNLLIND